MELTNAEYVFMELNKSIAPIIVQKLVRIENKNNYYRANCLNIRLVVQNYDNTITENAEDNPDVVRERIYSKKTEEDAKKFELEALRRYHRIVDVPTAPVETPVVQQPKPVREKRQFEQTKKSNSESCTKLCTNCGSGEEYLKERRMARNMMPSKQSFDVGVERRRNRENAVIDISNKITDPVQLKEMYPNAKSPTYYRNMRQTIRRDKDPDPLKKQESSSD
jgi:hypothetical protein